MKKIRYFAGIALIVPCFLGSLACSSNDSGKFAAITINTGLQNDKALTKEVAPRNITEILLTVTAEDMTTIEKIILLETGEVTVDVPSGPARTFTVRANTTLKTNYLEGSAVEDIEAYVPKDIVINMMDIPAHVTFNITNQVTVPITSYTLLVNNVANKSFTDPSTPVDLAPGTGYTLSVIANVNLSNPGATAVKSFIGTRTNYTLYSGDNTVSLTLAVNETKIVIPDYRNSRLVQINDVPVPATSGTGATVLSRVTIDSTEVSLYPYDVEFDTRGRIYIANNTVVDPVEGQYGGIIRVDNISGANPVQLVEISNPVTVYYDPVVVGNLNYIYYATSGSGSTIFRTSINESTREVGDEEYVDFSSVMVMSTYVTALYVNNGNVYATLSRDGGPGIIWFNFNSPPILENVDTYRLFYNSYGTYTDITVKSNLIYASYVYEGNGIYEYGFSATPGAIEPTLNYVVSGNSGADYFYGPQRFIATLNRKFYVMDEDSYGNPGDRIISFDDFTNYSGTWDLFSDPVGDPGYETSFLFFFNYGPGPQ